jgi:hypothetical protein
MLGGLLVSQMLFRGISARMAFPRASLLGKAAVFGVKRPAVRAHSWKGAVTRCAGVQNSAHYQGFLPDLHKELEKAEDKVAESKASKEVGTLPSPLVPCGPGQT